MFSLDNAFVWVRLRNVSGVVLTAAVEGEVSDELLRESGDSGMGRMMLSRPRRRQQGEGESRGRGLRQEKRVERVTGPGEVKPSSVIDLLQHNGKILLHCEGYFYSGLSLCAIFRATRQI